MFSNTPEPTAGPTTGTEFASMEILLRTFHILTRFKQMVISSYKCTRSLIQIMLHS